MNVLYQSAFLKALGWSLLDSFWQMGILWLLYILLTGNGKRFRSTQKHSLALLTLAGGSLWFIVTLVVHFYKLLDSSAVVASHLSNALSFPGLPAISVSTFIESVLPFLSLVYLATIIYLFIRLYRQYYLTQKLFTTGIYKVNPELRVFLRNIAAQMGIKKNVTIWLSSLVDTPLTIGFWKPVILLPVAAVNHLTLLQAEAIILHELNHIRRNDYFINLLIAFMDIILFFNPFVRIMTHIIKSERENSCDDMVLQFQYDAGQYANALLLLEKNRLLTPQLTINATGKSRKLLLNRVERILNKKSSGFYINEKIVAYILSAILIGFIGWYNPGKAIVKTIDTVKNNDRHGTFEQLIFSTPKAVTNKTSKVKSETAKKNIRKEKSTELPPVVSARKGNPLEEFAEWITNQQAELSSKAEAIEELVSFAGSDDETREFSIPETTVPLESTYSSEVHPYVPSTSFSYQFVEDTLFPKKYIPSQAEVKARESMATALKALQEIDWSKLEKEMTAAGKKIDIIKLQKELKKAMEEIDWKKIHEEMQSSLIDADNQLMQQHDLLRSELQKYQKEHARQQANNEKIYEAIIQDRLCGDKVKEPTQINKKSQPKKKIVHI